MQHFGNIMLSSKTHTDVRDFKCPLLKIIDYGYLTIVRNDVDRVKALDSLARRLDWHLEAITEWFPGVRKHLGVSEV